MLFTHQTGNRSGFPSWNEGSNACFHHTPKLKEDKSTPESVAVTETICGPADWTSQGIN